MVKYGSIAAMLITVLLCSAVAFAGEPVTGGKPIDLAALFRAVGAMYRLDPALLRAIATAESGNNAHAVSQKGAIGLMQLIPTTASEFSVTDPFDPVDNALGAARFLDYLRRHQACRDLPQLIAAYNAGAGAVERYRGIPPYPETYEYVRRVLRLYLLDDEPLVRTSAHPVAAENLPPGRVTGTQRPQTGDQALLDQLSDLKRERAAAVRAQ
jgi:soluble lytic murein transglycosylase-like protein